MDPDRLRASIETHRDESFVRASGPGGQHVNKTSSAAVCRLAIADLEGLSETERGLIIQKLGKRLTSEGELLVRAQESRSQTQNRELAVERMFQLILHAVKSDKPRRPSKPTRASKERRLESKHHSSHIKSLRSQKDF